MEDGRKGRQTVKSELLTSLKFKRLCKILGLPKPHVVGLLELLWQTGYAAASDIIGDEMDVETACEWDGEPGALAKVLLAERWLDIDESMTIHIHDFWEHAPQYVERKRSRLDATRSKIEEQRSKRAAVERANKSRANRKPATNKEVTEETTTDSQQLASDEPMASQQLAYPTQPNPTQPYDEDGHHRAGQNGEVAEAFAEAGIELDAPPPPPAAPPKPKPPSVEFVESLLRADRGPTRYKLSPVHRAELARLCEVDGDDAFRDAFAIAVNAEPRREGKGFVSYVASVLGTKAGKKAAQRTAAARPALTGKRVYE